jgi:glutamine transport system permease protein
MEPLGGLEVVWRNVDYLIDGATSTVRLSLVALVLALGLGAASGLTRALAPAPFKLLSGGYIELFRGTPVLVQMFFIFFGLPLAFGWNPSAFAAATCALTLNSGAYFGEIARGAVQSIPEGQWAAGVSSGMSRLQVLRFVVAPQAVRRMLPPAVGQFTILVKDTSVASVIGFFELTKAGQHVIERTFASFEILVVVGFLYFGVCYVGSALSQSLERRLSGARAGAAVDWLLVRDKA